MSGPRITYLAAIFLIGLLFLTVPKVSLSQETMSLGCCKTVKGTPACVGCGDGGLSCAIDGALCVETDLFELNLVCAESSIAGEAICQEAQASGCCVTAEANCADNISFDSCKGQHWFDGVSCSSVAMCAPVEPSSDHLVRNIVMIAILVVIVAFILFRRLRPSA